jgi:hypothetical protein
MIDDIPDLAEYCATSPRAVLLRVRTILQSISLLEKRLSVSSSIFERGQRMDPAPKASRRLETRIGANSRSGPRRLGQQ